MARGAAHSTFFSRQVGERVESRKEGTQVEELDKEGNRERKG